MSQTALARSVTGALDHILQGIAIFDASLHLVQGNKAFQELFSLPDTLVKPGTPLKAIAKHNAERGEYGSGDVVQLVENRLRLAKSKTLSRFERARPDGRIIEVQRSPLPDGGIVTIYLDITARVRAETAASASRERYRLLAEVATEGIFFHDAGIVKEVNQIGAEMFGYSREEMIGRNVLTLATPGAHATIKHNVEHGVETPYEVILLRKDGSTFPAEIVGRMIDWGGKRYRVNSVRDITARHAAAAALRLSEERHALAVAGSRDGIWDWDIERDEVYVSPRVEEILGITLTASTISSDMLFENYFPTDMEKVRQAVIAHFKGEAEVFYCEHRVITDSGDLKWVADRGLGQRDETGRVFRMAGSMTDITERKKAEAIIKESETKFRALFEQSALCIQIVSPEGKIIDVNHAWERLWGVSHAELKRADYNIFKDKALKAEGITKYLEMGLAGTACKSPPIKHSRQDAQKSRRWIEAFINPIKDDQNVVRQLIVMYEDVTERKTTEEVIRHQANYDTLTELPNRALFFDRLGQSLARAKRDNHKVALLYIDLDRFKRVNDTMGHAAGDTVLCEAARRLTSTVRASDTVSRLGGDEFTIILPDIGGVVAVEQVVRKIIDAFGEPFRIADQDFIVSTSIGVSLYPADATEVDTLINKADGAMFDAKERGRNAYRFFTPEMDTLAHERLKMERALAKAIDNEELHLVFQPIIDLVTGRIAGAEALLRWVHPEKGFIPPDIFIPIAEDTGEIVRIGDWVLQNVCTQTKAWREEGLPRFSHMAVNVSGRQFKRGLATRVAELLALNGLTADDLTLEITESLLLEDIDETMDVLREVKDLGIKMALDDFGTGYSSLSYLRRFPVNTLKIDRAFVKDVVSDPDAAILTKAITAMARSLGLSVVAEGVEDSQQLQFLRRRRCDFAQGYFFSRPLPIPEFADFVRNFSMPEP